jgi:hypothetical protein
MAGAGAQALRVDGMTMENCDGPFLIEEWHGDRLCCDDRLVLLPHPNRWVWRWIEDSQDNRDRYADCDCWPDTVGITFQGREALLDLLGEEDLEAMKS